MNGDAKDGGAAAGAEAEAPPTPTHPRVRLSVENFGPIEKGEVELRPLNVFVGPSNTGKTYLAVLVYGLYETLGSFSGFPVVDDPFDVLIKNDPIFLKDQINGEKKEEINKLYLKLRSGDTTLYLCDLPNDLQKYLSYDFLDPNVLKDIFTDEINKCFDVRSPAVLSSICEGNGMAISLALDEGTGNRWKFESHSAESNMAASCRIDNLPLYFSKIGKFKYMGLSSSITYKEKKKNIIHQLINYRKFSDSIIRRAHYLPAARTGIIQSYRVIASSFMRRGTRLPLKELPTVSGLLADFMERLTLHEEPGEGGGSSRGRERSMQVENLAAMLERKTLRGEIRAVRSIPNGLAEFVYRPRNTDRDISLSRASSMVTELAPLVLFLRDRNNGVRPGDTLIIEEPEAHLHPAAQIEMAKLLAELANADVQVIVTTHSDFLVQEIGNLMRAGELAARTGGKEGGDTRLRKEDVGVWLFRRGAEGAGSTVEEIPFDRIEGVDPPEYEDVAMELYNRGADLQDRLEELDSGTRE